MYVCVRVHVCVFVSVYVCVCVVYACEFRCPQWQTLEAFDLSVSGVTGSCEMPNLTWNWEPITRPYYTQPLSHPSSPTSVLFL